MPRQTPPLTLEERGGDHFTNLEAAQRAALPIVARDLAQTLRTLLASGLLAVEDGRVIVKQEADNPNAR